MKELQLAEGRNTGIRKMIKAMKQNGSDLPIFQTDDNRTYFRVVLPVHKVFVEEAKELLFQD